MTAPTWDSMRVVYLAHPLGHGEPERTANLERARRWLRYLIGRYPDVAFALPWVPYAEVLDESPENRARGIRDDMTMLRRCDGVALVGGRISPGMQAEADAAIDLQIGLWDMTHLGDEPPVSP